MNKRYPRKITLVLMGRSGSGKGTQAKFLLSWLKTKGVSYIETGQLLRNISEQKNSTSRRIKKVLMRGNLIPPWLGEFVWIRELIEKRAIENNLVFDGSPRTLSEAAILDEICRWHDRSLPFCIYLDVGNPSATARLIKRRRKDDSPEAIKNRMKFFSKDVVKVLNYYRREGRIIKVAGEGSILETKEKMFKGLSHFLKY